MTQPKYTHYNCGECQFRGHYCGHDIYECYGNAAASGGSLLARYGNEEWEYASWSALVFRAALVHEDEVLLGDLAAQAIVRALAAKALKGG